MCSNCNFALSSQLRIILSLIFVLEFITFIHVEEILSSSDCFHAITNPNAFYIAIIIKLIINSIFYNLDESYTLEASSQPLY